MLLIHRYNTPFLTGPSLHFTSLHFTSPTINTLHGTFRFNPLHCTSPHFTSPTINTLHGTLRFNPLHYTTLQFTALFRQFTTHSLSFQFTTLITFLNLFLKARGLQRRFPKISAGNRWGTVGGNEISSYISGCHGSEPLETGVNTLQRTGEADLRF